VAACDQARARDYFVRFVMFLYYSTCFHVSWLGWLLSYYLLCKNGGTATSQLRQTGYAGVIMGLTGNANEAEINGFLDAGANDVLRKPLQVKVLDLFFSQHLR
jgi:CheY-like chemotaxis protein